MPNELIWLIFLITYFCLILFSIYLFGKTALFAIISVSIVICNMQVIKTVELFGFIATLGNIVYGGLFLATDLLGEVFGKNEARKGVWLGFFSMILMTVSMQFALWFQPCESDFAHPAMSTIFGFMPRILFASLAAYLVSQHHDVWAFHFWRNRFEGRHLWLRNNLSTIVSQAADSLVFVMLAFYGVFSGGVLLSILFTTYFVKVMVALMDTPIVYAGRWALKQHFIKHGAPDRIAGDPDLSDEKR